MVIGYIPPPCLLGNRHRSPFTVYGGRVHLSISIFFFGLSTLNSLPFSLTYARSLRLYELNNNNNNNNNNNDPIPKNEQLVKIKTLTDNLKSEEGEERLSRE